MNALINLGAAISSVWLAVYAFSTLDETALGLAGLCMAGFFLATTLHGLWVDVGSLQGRGNNE